MNDIKDWDLYLAGRKYNDSIQTQNNISYYEMIDLVYNFYNGNQWKNATDKKLPKPVFNYIKRALTFFVASLTSSNTSITLESATKLTDPDIPVLELELNRVLEKNRIENRIRDLLFDGGITGDGAMHVVFDPDRKQGETIGAIDIEMLDSSNVMFGNPNVAKIEKQPYVIVVGRDLAVNLQKEVKERIQIAEDNNTKDMAGYNASIELDADKHGKATYILVYRRDKKTGTIKVSKSVENGYIYKEVDTKLNHYPIVWYNWDKQKNSYHGRGIVEEQINNQIAINKMFAMVIYHLMLTAFPTAVYNADKLNGWSNEIGSAIPLTDMRDGESIKNIAGYLEPASMSNQITSVIEQAIRYMKECLGLSDVLLGAVDPKNTSAIIAVQKAAVVPLENARANLYEAFEDLGMIIIDMIATKYGKRKSTLQDEFGSLYEEAVDFSKYKDKWIDITANVGASAYYSEIANLQTLDNLLASEKISFLQYLERLPENILPKKEDLIDELKKQLQLDDMQTEAQKQAEYQQLAEYMESLPLEVQERLRRMPDAQQEQTLREMMEQDPELQPEAQARQQFQGSAMDMIGE